MTEQHRFLMATLLSVAVLFFFQLWFEPPLPEEDMQGSKIGEPLANKPSSSPSSPGQNPTRQGQSPSLPAATTLAAGDPAAFSWATWQPNSTRPIKASGLQVRLADTIPHLTELTLDQYHETLPGASQPTLVTLLQASQDPMLHKRQALLLLYVDNALVDNFAFEHDPSSPATLLARHQAGVTLQVQMQPTPPAYGLSYALKVTNESSSPHQLAYHLLLNLPDQPGDSGWFAPPQDEVSALCLGQEGLQRHKMQALAQQGQQGQHVRFAGLDRQYFLLAAIPQQGTAHCKMEQSGDSMVLRLQSGVEHLAAGQTFEQGLVLYAGPKKNDMLQAVDPILTEAIDYNLWAIPLGFLARPMVAILNVFHQFSGSWGIAIILLTVLIKTLLFPVTYRSAISMKKMQDLKPALDKLKQRFGSDPERLQLEQMKLYKESGINPVAGCLPMLLQMPVWIALYRMLWSAVDLYEQPFLWIQDLTAKEPLPIMAIAVGLLTLLQQRLTPMAADNPQAKVMMYMMPVMLSVFMIALPSGLVLYILVNSVLTIVQQVIINRRTVAV